MLLEWRFFKSETQSSWFEANQSENITVGLIGKYDLKEIRGIKDGYDVKLGLNAILGKDIKADEIFTYKFDSTKHAYYEASGSCHKTKLECKKELHKCKLHY